MDNTPSGHNINQSAKTLRLEQMIEAKFLELFGEEHLHNDKPLLKNIQIINKRINTIQADTIPLDIQFEKAMATYKRDKDAAIKKYNFEKEMRFPPTLRCQIKEAAGVPSQTIDDFENETEDAIQIKIDSTEKATIEEQIPTSDNISHLAISNKKRKRELWAYQRNLARKIQKGLLTKKTTENPYSTLS